AGPGGTRTSPACAAPAGTTSTRSARTARTPTRRGRTASAGPPRLFFQAAQDPLGPLDFLRVLLVAARLRGPPVAGLEQGQVAAGLAVAEAEAGVQGLGQLPAGPGAVLAEQLGQLVGHSGPTGVVRLGAGLVGVQGLGASGGEALEGGPDGMRMAAQVLADAWRRPAGSGQEDHFQTGPGHGGAGEAAPGRA